MLSPYSQMVNKYQKKLEETDSILDYDSFVNIINEMLAKSKEEKVLRGSGYGVNSYFYGYYSELLNYANVTKSQYLIPSVEHGVCFADIPWAYDPHFFWYISQSANRKADISSLSKGRVIVLPVGAYIQYSRYYYDLNKRNTLKNKYGKTLLVMPTHTWEGSQDANGVSEDIVDMIYRRYGSQFDTIMVCVYWHDVNSETYKKFQNRGAKLVSAGFRGDQNFIRRLKTIIDLSDAVFTDGLGTNIGFCMSMGKKIFIDNLKPLENDIKYNNNNKLFAEAFMTNNDGNYSDEQVVCQKNLYDKFWGNIFYSPEELHNIFDSLHNVLVDGNYSFEQVGNVIENIWRNSNSTEYDSVRKYIC